MRIFGAFKGVFDLRKTWKSFVVDLLFFFVLGAALGLLTIRDLIGQNLLALGDTVIQQSATLKFSELIFQSVYFQRILLLAGAAALVTYPLYCLFHGWLWKYACQLRGKEFKVKKFFLVNLLWFPLFCVYVLVSFLFSYVDTIAQRLNPGTFPLMGTISNILFFLIVYFAFLSYALLTKEKAGASIRKAFSMGFGKKGFPLAVALVVMVAAMLLISSLSAVSSLLFLILTYVSYPALMIWLRFVALEVVEG
ncbi:MAG: hypothetical protein Q7S65_01235 [Nanoarchaeota archaeon]|nr:hypothetical protein [Nanoarchaeota archaeon]